MINEVIPVVIRLTKGGEEAVCTAGIIREGDRFYAVPELIVPAVAGFHGLLLEEDKLELVPNPARGRPTYRYRATVTLEP